MMDFVWVTHLLASCWASDVTLTQMAEAKQKGESCLLALFWLQTRGGVGLFRENKSSEDGEKGLLIQGEGTD